MRAGIAAFVLVAAFGGTAVAQAPGKEQPLDAFLQQRVAEELATDGTLLSRLGVALEIQLVGETVIVSLVESSSGRTVASTKVDRVPGDREAAVAQVAQVAANLVDQLTRGPYATPAAHDAPQTQPSARTGAELDYQEHALGFSDSDEWWGRIGDHKAPYRGTVGRPLTEQEFFTEVERPDLAATVHRRRIAGTIGVVGGAVAVGFGLWRADNSTDDNGKKVVAGVALGTGALALIGGIWCLTHESPLSQGEVFDLATAHNHRLQERYGLRVSPYAAPTGGGFSVAGGF